MKLHKKRSEQAAVEGSQASSMVVGHHVFSGAGFAFKTVPVAAWVAQGSFSKIGSFCVQPDSSKTGGGHLGAEVHAQVGPSM